MILQQELHVMNDEKAVEIFRALSNQTRLHILQMLKNAETNFSPQEHVIKEEHFKGGVCVSDIHKKTGTSQSTTSQYLSTLLQSGLLETKRIGQWTYYRRNEEMIKQFALYTGLKL